MAHIPVLEPARAPAMVSASDADFEVRWAAWQQRSAAHDRAVRARARALLPLFVAASLSFAYFLLSR